MGSTGHGPLRVPRLSTLVSTLLLLAAAPETATSSPAYQVENPLWLIQITERGYSDFLVEGDQLYLREYLSGEWAAALYWAGAPGESSVWFEPDFVFPDWTTNSNFTSLTQPFTSFDGGKTFTSTFDNGVFRVMQTLEMIDTALLAGGPGVAQGRSPASAGATSSFSVSNRYVLKHSYAVTNISGSPVDDVRMFQFLHGLNATEGVYDDRAYPAGAFQDYRYDISQWGRVAAVVDLDVPFEDPNRYLAASGFQFFFDEGGTDDDVRMLLGMSAGDIDQWLLANLGFTSTSLAEFLSRGDAYQVNVDTIAFHSRIEPDAFEIGEFGNPGNSDHEFGKPPTGVHLSVESGSLDGVSDEKTPDGLWVGGAQQFDWGTIAANETRTIDVLLSIDTTEELFYAPEAAALPSAACALGALAALAGGRRRRRHPAQREAFARWRRNAAITRRWSCAWVAR
jgi:hypothetical protein